MPQDQDRQLSLEDFEEQRRQYYGLPKGMTEALRTQESGGRQYDRSGGVLTSPKQAKGRYQVLKSTAAQYNLDPDDPFENVEASFRYLSDLHKQVDAKVSDPGERWAQTLAGYHAGEGRLREVNKTGSLPSTSDGLIRTDEYVGNIMKRWQQHDQGRSGEQPTTPAPQPKPAEETRFDLSKSARLGPDDPNNPLAPPKSRPLTARQRRLAADETARIKATPAIARMVQDFEALKREGSVDAARSVAAKIKQQYGQWMEVGEGDGWPYVKSKVRGWNPIQPTAGPSTPSLADQQVEFAQLPLSTQIYERAADALARGGGQVSKMARQALGAGFGAAQALAGGKPEIVDFPSWRAGEEARFRTLEERRQARPSSFASEVGEGIVEAVPAASGAILGTVATGGGLPAAMAIGGGMGAAGADWRDPARALTQTGLGAVAPVVGGKAGSAVGRAVASRIARPVAQSAARAGGELAGGGAGNVLASGAEQLAFEGRLDPRELAKQAVVGSALNVPGAASAARRTLPPPIAEAGAAARPQVDAQQATDIGIRQVIDRYTQAVDQINRSQADPGSKAAQLAQARATYQAERQAARQTPQATEAPSMAPDAATTPTVAPELPPGVTIIRQGEHIPPREKGQRQIPIEVDRGDGTVEPVIVLAPEWINGQRVNETMLRPFAEQALRPQQTPAAQPSVTETGAQTAAPQSQPAAPSRRQPPPIQFTQLGAEGLRAARTPGGAILAPESSLPSRKLLGPGRPEDVPTEQLVSPTRSLPRYPSGDTQGPARPTVEMPEIRARIAAEEAPTAELPARVAGQRRAAEDALTQEPTNRIVEGEGPELPRVVSRPLEGQPIETPGPRRPRTERLPVSKATPENIDALRKRQEELGRLAYDRRGDFTGDLRDEYNQLAAHIRNYDNEQAKIAGGGLLEEAPPPGVRLGRMTPMPPAEKGARRAALQPPTSEFPEASPVGRKVTRETQLPPALKPSESFASREDARQGYFERFNDKELVAEITRMQDLQNMATRGRSRLSREELEAVRFDHGIAVEMQKERLRLQRQIGIEPGERIAPRTPGRPPARQIQHGTFGLVTETPDQSGVPKGKLRVVDDQGDKHFIQNPRTRGNREATFVKQRPSTGAIPADAMPELQAPGAPPSPLAMMGKEAPSRGRQSYAIPEEAAPDLSRRTKPKFVADAEQRLKDAAAGKLAGSGTRQIADAAIVTGWKVYEAGMDFGRWSAEVIKQAGEKVRPHLRAAWDRIQTDYKQMERETGAGARLVAGMKKIAYSPTSPVQIAKLRAQFPNLSKEQFDTEMLKLAHGQRIALLRHDHPASLSKAERNALVKDKDDYFIAATFREGKGTVMGSGLGSLQPLFERGQQTPKEPAKPGDLTFRERVGRKIATTQTAAQLLNPKTIAQNVIGNAAFSGAKQAATIAAIPVDKFLSLITKQRQVSTPELRTQFNDFVGGFTDIYHAVRSNDYAALADNRYELSNERVFKGKVGGFFEDALNISLRAPDKGAYLAAYNDSVQQILKGHAKSKTKFSLDKIHEQAKVEAQQAVFQDENIISKFAVGLRDTLNIVTPFGKKANFGLGDLVGLKYARTPANLLARGIEYSPLNFVNAFYKIGKVMAGKGNGKDFDQRNAALAFGKAFVGSAFGSGLGAALYSMGIITQPEQENRGVQAAERAEGLTGYQLNLSALKRYASGGLLNALTGDLGAGKKQAGDVLMSYDWMQPWAFSLGMGAAVSKAFKHRKADADALEDTLTQIDAVTSTLTDQSILRNIRDSFRFGVKSTGRKILTDTPASFVPSALNQARQIIDDRAREISREKGAGGIRREALDKVLNKLPGASKRLPERKDIVGRSVPSRMAGTTGAALVPIPGRFGEYRPHPVLSEMQEAGAGATGISRKDGEREGQYRARRAVAAEWLNKYGLELTASKAFKSAPGEIRKAALEYLTETISKQSGEKRPSLYLLNPGRILQVVYESQRREQRKAAQAGAALQ